MGIWVYSELSENYRRTDIYNKYTYDKDLTWTGELWTPKGLGFALNLWSTLAEWVVSVITNGDFEPIDLAVFPVFLK